MWKHSPPSGSGPPTIAKKREGVLLLPENSILFSEPPAGIEKKRTESQAQAR